MVGRVRERRRRLASDDRRGLVDKLVIDPGLHHEQGQVHTPRDYRRGAIPQPTEGFVTRRYNALISMFLSP